MVLWGDPGTGKTTIARVIASMVKSRFIEINSTNFGVGECKKFFSEVYLCFIFVSRTFIENYSPTHRPRVNRNSPVGKQSYFATRFTAFQSHNKRYFVRIG
jgi:hypothetical protein